jgi:predicted transcriptional regulator
MENKGLQVTIRLKPEVKRQLRIVAAEQDTNMSVLAEHLVKAGLEEYMKHNGLPVNNERQKPPKDAA